MRSKAALDIPADSGEAGVGTNIRTGLRGVEACLDSRKVCPVPIAVCLPRAISWCRLMALDRPRRTTIMAQFNDTKITTAVISSFEEPSDPRVEFLMEELVKSLHEYVRKTDLTFDEWGYAIDFLTASVAICTSGRPQFILLSDVPGVSRLVDAGNHRERDGGRGAGGLGPFYGGESKPMPHGADISAN